MTKHISLVAMTAVFLLIVFSGGSSFGQPDGATGGDTGGFTGGDTGGATGFPGFEGFNIGENAFSLATEVPIEPSLRFEIGYVGPTSGDVDAEGSDSRSLGFIGQRNEGLPTGGINNSVEPGTANAGGRGGAGAGGLGSGTSLYFEVQRRGVRARLRQAFSISAPIDSSVFASQFVSRMDRMPATRELSKGYNVSVANKTATITGVVGSQEESKRIERQLRFEPGVYRIVNNLQIQQ